MDSQYVIKVRTKNDLMQLFPVFGFQACESFSRHLQRDRPMWLRTTKTKIVACGFSHKGDYQQCPYFNGELGYEKVVQEFETPFEFLMYIDGCYDRKIQVEFIDDVL